MKTWLCAAALGALSVTAALGCSSSSSSPEATRAPEPAAPFVLVHGAWMGAWAWDDVAAGLREQGAKVTVVELPAHGGDTTSPAEATLAAYAAKVLAAIEAEKAPVVLVAHSMAGVVATEVAERRPDRIAKLVYLAAFVPKEGDSLQTLAGKDADSLLGPVLQIDGAAGTAGVPAAKLQEIFCADCTPAKAAALTSKYRAEPLAPFGTALHPTSAGWGRVPKHYAFTRNDRAVSYASQQAMTAGITFVSTATLDTSHSPFLSQPALVVSTLLGF